MPTDSLETRVEQLEARVADLAQVLDLASRRIEAIYELGLQKLIGPELQKLLAESEAKQPKPKRSRKPRT